MQMQMSETAKAVARPHAPYPAVQYGMHWIWRSYLRIFRPAKFEKFREQRYRPMTDNHSCRPFDQLRCIFVHIPKCAGISVSRSLFGNVSGAHHTLRKFQIMFSPAEFDQYFKFTFVRNPWDRAVSAYHFLKKGGLTLHDRTWSERYLSPYPDFQSFVLKGLENKRVISYPHFRPQCDYICLKRNEPGLDFIGYFENLDADFTYITQVLNVNSSLLSLNRNHERSRDFRSYYTDETREIIARVYADDIRVMGYTFDNASVPEVLKARDQRTQRHL